MKRIAFFIVSIYCFTACTSEVIYGPVNPTGETKPRIELVMPDAERVSVYSTATFSENTIDTIWVLAFNGSTAKWVEKIPGSLIIRNGHASQLLPQLANEPVNGDTIVCIANVDPNPDTVNVTHATINNCFPLKLKSYYYGTEFLPMYGEFVWSSSSSYTCTMIRAVAKIQIQMGTSVSDVTGNFTADSVTYSLQNFVDEGYIQPSSTIQVLPQPYTDYSSRLYLLQNKNATELNSTIYLYEFPSSNTVAPGNGTSTPVNDTDFDADRQHIILYKANGPSYTTHYRLDFYNPLTGKFLNLERNHHYLFTINKVRSEGYQGIDHAQYYPGSNIEYTLQINDDTTTRIVSNGQYAILTTNGMKDTVEFQPGPGPGSFRDTVLWARYVLPDQITQLVSGTIKSVEVETVTGPLNAFYIIGPSELSASFSPVRVGVSSGTPDGSVGVVIFCFGNITHRVYFIYRQ